MYLLPAVKCSTELIYRRCPNRDGGRKRKTGKSGARVSSLSLRVCVCARAYIRATEITQQRFSHGTPHRPRSPGRRRIPSSCTYTFARLYVCVSMCVCACAYIRVRAYIQSLQSRAIHQFATVTRMRKSRLERAVEEGRREKRRRRRRKGSRL